MKTLIVKILKIFLFLLLIALALLLVFGLVLVIGWPLWVGIFFVIGLIGIFLGFIFLKKRLAHKNEQRFVQQIIAQDESRIKSLSSSEQAGSRELQMRWKAAIDTLRKSHLKKYGNPLYVLPWYMIIGESGCGKTTAIKGAELATPFADVNRASGISGTRNCDWWFFEQAVLLDTAGRYAVPVDEARDRDEWQQFLSLLARFRKREPLNGLVVAVAADQLLESDAAALEGAGQSIRRRVDELMRVLGAKFPVYIMVTKCDLIQGAVPFCDQLDEPVLKQAMGRLNHPLSADSAAFAEQALRSTAERLKELRLIILNRCGAGGNKPPPALLMFPEEFEKVGAGLQAFMRGALQQNPYQETPILRGIYFSSGRQEGTPYSHFLSAMGLISEKDVLPGTNRGLFLHDFFSRILPNDRKLFAPTQRRLAWNRLNRSIGLTAWVAVMIAVCGLLSFSFVKNLKTLRDVTARFDKPPVLQGDLTADVLTLDRYRRAVSRVAEQNAHWWIPRLGLTESVQVEAGLKRRYCEIFKAGFLKPFDRRMRARMTGFSAATPPALIGDHVMYLARRINLLRRRMDGAGIKDLQRLPAVIYPSALLGVQTIKEVSSKLAGLYLYYLAWQTSGSALNDELKREQTWLKHILTLPGARLNWLVNWVNRNGGVPPVDMAAFWGTLPPDADDARVSPAFTGKGRAAIDGCIGEIEKALFEPLAIGAQKQAFEKWYAQAYINAWHAFAMAFSAVPRHLKDRDQWRRIGAILPSAKGPYLSLLDSLATELDVVRPLGRLPAWAELARRFQAVRMQAGVNRKAGRAATGFFKKATRTVTSTVDRLEGGSGAKSGAAFGVEDRIAAGDAFNRYLDALKLLKPMTDSPNIAYKMAADLYSQDPAAGDSPFFKARRALQQLQAAVGLQNSDTALFWDLASGPIRFYHEYADREAQCYLQHQWEKDVYLEVQGLPQGANLDRLLMGPDGYAAKFIKGPAQPFIGRSTGKGYFAKSIDGFSLDLNDRFLTFLTRSAGVARPVASRYLVTVKAFPTDANKSARIKPQATSLEVQCGNETNRLLNLHYPVKKTFRWSPQECGDVVFKIEIGNLVLKRVYSGYLGFAKFLKDFRNGQHTFRPADFPASAAALKRMGIKTITPRYRFSGQRPVIRLLRQSPGRVPRDITTCWGG
jgi:type VI secretion system protein ImpL